jgi:hypothetical protein
MQAAFVKRTCNQFFCKEVTRVRYSVFVFHADTEVTLKRNLCELDH